MGKYDELVKDATALISADEQRTRQSHETMRAMLQALVLWLEVPRELMPLRFQDKNGDFVGSLHRLLIDDTNEGFRAVFQVRLVDQGLPAEEQLLADMECTVLLQPQGGSRYTVYLGKTNPLQVSIDSTDTTYTAFCEAVVEFVKKQLEPKEYN